jgi:tripartite-type tricarboxylate transporter receptor subunit TctC
LQKLSEASSTRPVRIIVGFAAGGPADTVARLIGQWLSERLGQPIVVDNRSGANGNIGTEIGVRASPDGYTLLMTLAVNAINAAVYDNLSFNFIRDTAPVASIASIPLVMEVNPSVPAKTVPEFVAYAKANAGKINMASAGIGSPQHVAGELFKMMAGVDMVHVPYRGDALVVPDLISGQVQVYFGVMLASLGYIRVGKLRALAVTSATRQEALPDVPTMGEFLPGFEARLTDLGCAVFAGSPADFGKFIADETEKKRLVRDRRAQSHAHRRLSRSSTRMPRAKFITNTSHVLPTDGGKDLKSISNYWTGPA